MLDAEQTTPTDLTVASLAISTISMICFGKDDLAKKYMAACIRVGEELHLFGTNRHGIDQVSQLPVDAMPMLSCPAWGAFNVPTCVHSLCSFHVSAN